MTKQVEIITLDDEDDEVADVKVETEESRSSKIECEELAKKLTSSIFEKFHQISNDWNASIENTDDIRTTDDKLTSEENIKTFFADFRQKVLNEEFLSEMRRKFNDLDIVRSRESFSSRGNYNIECGQTRKKKKTLYRCQISECDFTTDRRGMQDGRAAKHLGEFHSLTGRDMERGEKKFKKIKVEKTQ